MSKKKRVTSVDVARLAGVSQSAVSRAFTPGASISPEVRRRVLEAARALAYRPNVFARSLITRRSRMVGLVVGNLANPYYSTLIDALSRGLRGSGYHVLIFITEAGDADEVLQEILQYPVAGIFLASATLSSGLAKECAEAGIPVVLLNRYIADSPTSSVTSDNVEGGRLLGRFLAAGGHRRIAFIAGDERASTSRDRERGFGEGLREFGLDCRLRAVGGYSFAGAAAAVQELFSGDEPPDAIFAANDYMAIAALDTLRHELGLKVPGQVSVVGYDDAPQAGWLSYRLTTVRQSAQTMVDSAVGIFFRELAGHTEAHSHIRLPATLVVRDSARLPPA